MELSKADHLTLQKLEEALWITETRFNAAFMENTLSADFIEIGRSGRIYSRADCLSQTATNINAVLPLNNLKVRCLTFDVVQITYDSEVTYNGTVERGRRSSIWTKSGNQWKFRFHQGTPFN